VSEQEPYVEVEYDEDDSSDEPVSQSNVTRAIVTGTDWTVETIISQMRKGNIQLDPRFQRRDAWEANRKSRFIESLLLGLPIPQLVLAEDKNKRGSFLVLDGKQRLLSLRQFSAVAGDEFEQLKLKSLDVRNDLVGLSLSDMEASEKHAEDVDTYMNQPIRTVVLRSWPDETFLNMVFLRLNTGGVQLSPQELRQALHPGPFTSYLDDYSSQSAQLQVALRLSRPDFRMRDVELLLRFYAINLRLGDYRGNLKQFLDDTVDVMNRAWDENKNDIEKVAIQCDRSIEVSKAIFGADVFCGWNGDRYERRFNRAVFDVMAYFFKFEDIGRLAIENKESVEGAFRNLCASDDQFRRSIQLTTKTNSAVVYRIDTWGQVLAGTIGGNVPRVILNDKTIVASGQLDF